MPLEVVDVKNLTAEFYHLKVKCPIYANVHVFDPQMLQGVELEGIILVTMKSSYPLS